MRVPGRLAAGSAAGKEAQCSPHMLWGEANEPSLGERGAGTRRVLMGEDGVAEKSGAMGAAGRRGLESPPAQPRAIKGRCFSLKEPKYPFSYDCRSHFKPYLGGKSSPSASHSALPTQHRPCPVFPCALDGGWQLSRLSWGWLRSISMYLAAGTFHFISSHA